MKELRKPIIGLLVFLMLLLPAVSHADMREEDGSFYFYSPNSGFIIKLITPQERNITTNIIDRIDFELWWYDQKNEYHKRDPINYARRVNPHDVNVFYTNKNAMSQNKDILLDRSASLYTIRDYETKLSASGDVKIPIKIKNLVAPTGPNNHYPGVYNGETNVQISIDLRYFHNDKDGGKFYTSFKTGKVKMFADRLILDFPKDTYVHNTSMSTLLPEQDILVQVNQRPASTQEYMFISQSYTITDKYERNDTKPSQSGNITLKYDADVAPEVAMHNISVVQRKDNKWIPIGGVVDSKGQTVTAPIDEFGEYAAAITYKTYKLDNLNNWAKPYVLALAYKGVIQPDIYLFDGRLLEDLDAEITRFDFIMMLARAKGLKPISYTGYFTDVNNATYGKARRGYDGTGYLMSAIKNGFVQGETSNVFGNVLEPERPLTREEAAVFMARAMNLKIPTYSNLDKVKEKLSQTYYDAPLISDWAVPYVDMVTKEKLMQGNLNYFKPRQKLTVAEASTLVYNMMDKMKLFGK